MEKKAIKIYRLGNTYKIHSDSRTTTGLWIATEPFYTIPTNIEIPIFLDILQKAIDASKSNILHPSDWNSFQKSFKLSMKITSWSQLENKSKHCSIISYNDCLIVTGYKKSDDSKGLVEDYNKVYKFYIREINEEVLSIVIKILND